MITIDGSRGEGGGQIIRTALALSTITGKAFTAENIRSGRPKPGLKTQHVQCIKALEQLCGARHENVFEGSESITFYPGDLSKMKTKIDIDIGTAGSITLLLQSLLIPCIASGKNITIKIKGGTDTSWSIPIDYLANVVVPHLRVFANIEIKILKRGYYPKGGGEVEASIRKKKLADDSDLQKNNAQNIIDQTDQGRILQIRGISHASKDLMNAKVAERQSESARIRLMKFGVPVTITNQYCDALSTGSGIVLWALFSKGNEFDFISPIIMGADALGEREKRAEDVGKEAAENLLREIDSKAPIDSHLADNLVPFIAYFGGKIKVSSVTEHTLSNIYACESFLERKIDVQGNVISA